jgi:MoxR-like ATPase
LIPLQLKLALRAGLENDRYVRKTDGYLPTAEVAFVDEIFKANSAILNALLTLLNERLFDNGNQRLPVPLLCLVGASNELPESEELDALYDRFLIRRTVAQVRAALTAK